MQALDLMQGLGAAAAAAAPGNGANTAPAAGEETVAFGTLVEDALGRAVWALGAGDGSEVDGLAPTVEEDPSEAIDASALAVNVSVLAPVPAAVPTPAPVSTAGEVPAEVPAFASQGVAAPAAAACRPSSGPDADPAGAAVAVARRPTRPAEATPLDEGSGPNPPAPEGIPAGAVAGMATQAPGGRPVADSAAFSAIPGPPAPVVEAAPAVAPAAMTGARVPPVPRAGAGLVEPAAATGEPRPFSTGVAEAPVPLAAVPLAALKPEGQAQPGTPSDPVGAVARELARMTSTPATPASETPGVVVPSGMQPAGGAGNQSEGGEAGAESGGGRKPAPATAEIPAPAGPPHVAAVPDGAAPVRGSVTDVVAPPVSPAAVSPAAGDSGTGERLAPDAIGSRASQIEALLGSNDPDRQNVHGIVRTLRIVASGGGASEARLRLQPEHLGQLALNIRVEQGSVSAHFHTENPDAQRWIESHQQELRSALRQQGLEVKELVVSSTDPDRRQQGRQPERDQPRRPRRDAVASWDRPRFEVVA